MNIFQPILVIPSPAVLEPFGTSEVNGVEQTFAGTSTRAVPPDDQRVRTERKRDEHSLVVSS